MEKIRSFIAIELSAELRKELHQLEDRLKSSGQSPVKWVNPDNVHLTLKFLGNIDVNSIKGIVSALEKVAQVASPFRLSVNNMGVFPSEKGARVAWVGLSGDVDRLLQLQRHIEFGLENLGFPPESRAFTPHLTLARFHKGTTSDERQRFSRVVTNTRFEATSTIYVTAISLIKSQLTRQGAIYSHLALVNLKGKRAKTK